MTEAEAALECAALYTAMAAGKTILFSAPGKNPWLKITAADNPSPWFILNGWRYRVIPDEPETVWAIRSQSNPGQFYVTDDKSVAQGWRDDGLTVYGYELAGTSFRTP